MMSRPGRMYPVSSPPMSDGRRSATAHVAIHRNIGPRAWPLIRHPSSSWTKYAASISARGMTPRNSAWLVSSSMSFGIGVAVHVYRYFTLRKCQISAVRVFPSLCLRIDASDKELCLARQLLDVVRHRRGRACVPVLHVAEVPDQRRAGLPVALLEDRRLVNHHGIQPGRVELEGHLGISDPDTGASRLSGRPDVADIDAELRRFPHGLVADGHRRDDLDPAADQASGLQLDKRLAGPCVQPVADPGEPDVPDDDPFLPRVQHRVHLRLVRDAASGLDGALLAGEELRVAGRHDRVLLSRSTR